MLLELWSLISVSGGIIHIIVVILVKCALFHFSFFSSTKEKKTLTKTLNSVMRNEVCKPLYSEIQMYQTAKWIHL